MADLTTTVQSVLQTAETLKAAGAAANEANTKAHMIEPVLSALGWNMTNFHEVDREYKVFDGTFLDYALRIDGKPKLFVEAKALGRTLADKQFIAQTINYANNEGVVWCVLTNGLLYQVYKSNEPVGMERKLLFEVNIRDASDEAGRAGVISSLATLGRQAVESGALDVWGETVFTDLRVRQALSQLGNKPPPSLIKAVSAAIDGSSVDGTRLRASLKRLLGGLSVSSTGVAIVGGVPQQVAKQGGGGKLAPEISPGKTATFGVEHHTAKKPSGILDLFQRIDSFARALGPDVEQRPVKYYMGYVVGKKSFFTLNLKQTKIDVYISLPPEEVKPWDAEELRDVRKIGKHGLGDTEFVLRSPEQLPRLEKLLKEAYLRNRK